MSWAKSSCEGIQSSGLLPDEGAAWLRERMVRLHDTIRTLADRYGALYIDLFNDPASANPAFYSADLKHANAAGQDVAERTLDGLAGALKRSRRAA